jgi:heme/copper-type cytochrome/quinol oxidase subunit 2
MSANSPQLPENAGQTSTRWTIANISKIAAAVIIGVILLIFIIGVLIALFTDAEQTAAKVQLIRDLFIIVLTLQGILIIAALAVLILQVARLINLLQNEVMPILNNARETLNAAKGTVDFVSTNVADPVIRVGGFLAGMRILVGELGGIRRAVRHENGQHEVVKRD